MRSSDGWRWRRGGYSGRDIAGRTRVRRREVWSRRSSLAEERTQPSREELGMGKRCEFSGQVQLTAFEGRLQTGDELATKHAPQYSNGKEEAWMGSNPAGV